MEFSPYKKFEDRRSIICNEEKTPIPFKKVERRNGVIYLDTGKMTIVSKDNEKDFFPSNLEIRWMRDGLLQFWRPGDRDSQNLGGTVRSLDLFDKHSQLGGEVHTADDSHPDNKAQAWLSVIMNLPQKDIDFKKKEELSPDPKRILKEGVHAFIRRCPQAVRSRTINKIVDQYKYSPGVISRSGYYLLNDSISAVMDNDDFPVERNTPGTKDYYFFCYNDDFKDALKNYILLTGKSPLPTKNAFGIWFSRWPAFDECEAKQIIMKFKEKGIPLSILILDLEWHKPIWCHWVWNKKMYPAPKTFLNWCHSNKVDVSLNVHYSWLPSDVPEFNKFIKEVEKNKSTVKDVDDGQDLGVRRISLNICDKKQTFAFMKYIAGGVLKQGVDFWWVDGTNLEVFIDGCCPQLVHNKVFFENIEKIYGAKRRGMLLSRYGGMGSHRYGVTFSGDLDCQWEVLEKLCEFNIRAGHLGISYISHDIGGFGLSFPKSRIIDPILYLRWVQFGVFSPIFRFHSSKTSGSRKPWDYGRGIEKITIQWLKFRNSMIPYIYSEARKHYENGIPIVRGLFIEHSQDECCYRYDEYYFGSAFIVAPILNTTNWRKVYLPEGKWYDYKTGNLIKGKVEFTYNTALEDVPIFAKAGSIVPRQNVSSPSIDYVSELVIDVFPGTDGSYVMYEDDGKSQRYKSGEFLKTRYDLKDKKGEIEFWGNIVAGKAPVGSRKIMLNIFINKKPRTVLFNNRELDSKSIIYRKAIKRAEIYLPEIPIEYKYRLTIVK